MRTIILRGEEYRAWRQNVYVLVGEDGLELRAATAEEIQGWFYSKNKGLKFQVTVGEKTYQLKSRREVIRTLYLNEYGPCILKGPNGTNLAFIRGSEVRAPLPAQGSALAPHPSQCQCKDWGGTVPGKHHFACHFNQYAPPDQQSSVPASPVVASAPMASRASTSSTVLTDATSRPTTARIQPTQPLPALRPHTPRPVTVPLAPKEEPQPVGEIIDGVFVMTGEAPEQPTQFNLKKPTSVSTHAATVQKPPTKEDVPSPADCICAQYANKTTGPNHHHIWCQFYNAWESIIKGQPLYVVVDLTTGQTLREATPDEVTEALSKQSESGVPLITISDVQYGVVPSDPADVPEVDSSSQETTEPVDTVDESISDIVLDESVTDGVAEGA